MSCGGCCRDGLCMTGDTVFSCGAGGLACDVCVGGQVCSAAGRCEFGGGVGGGTATGGGGGTATGGGGASGGGSATGGGGSTCVPPTSAELCLAAVRECGPLTVIDRCGTTRTVVSCGTCTAGEACAGGVCVCQPETSAAICQRLARSCGTATTTDNCGAARTVSCGTCSGSSTCGGGSTPGGCGCTPESDAQYCARVGRSCGGTSGLDNCGTTRSIASCGTCTSPNTCTFGQCSCSSETNSQFCTRLGAACGPISGVDSCGQTRNVASCGSCTGSTTCGGGGTANQCGCTPQTDAVLCAARGKDCGSLTVTDNCGATRTLACGSCGGVSTCGGGGTANVCGCTAETNATFCTRVGAQCGAVTAADNCGATRTVSSCGACTNPATCTPSSQCVCTPESDAALCAREGKTCGTLVTTDTCGAARTITSCGSCGAGTQCGPATNVCLPVTPLPATGICTTNGFCWEQPATGFDGLQAVWVEASGVAWAAGAGGSLVRWDGSTVRGFRHLRNTTFTAVWVGSATDVWVGGPDGLVLRFNGSVWEDLSLPTTKDVSTIWGDGQGKVYVGGQDNLIRLWINGTWTTPFSMPSSYDDVRQLTGHGAGIRLIGVYGQYEWPGTGTTVNVISEVSGWCSYTSQVSVSASEVWGARYCWSSGSSTNTQQAFKTVGPSLVWATLPASTTNGTAQFAARSPSDVWLFGKSNAGWHFDGLAWTTAVISPSALTLNAGHGSPARAVFVGGQGTLFGQTGAGWVNSAPDAGFPAAVGSPSSMSVLPISDSRAVAWVSRYASSGTGAQVLSMWHERSWVGTLSLPAYTSLVDAWSPDGTTAFALVEGSAPSLYRFDGSTWALVGTPPSANYESLAGSSATNQWLAGWGKMVRYDGAAFTEVPTPYSGTSTQLNQLLVVTASLAFVRAGDGQLLKWDGSTWAIDTGFGTTALDVPMWKSQQGSVHVVSALGLRRFAGGVWTTLALPAGNALGKVIYGSTDSDVSVSTSAGACRWNGSAWTCATMPPGLFQNQRVVQTGARQWLVPWNLGDNAGAPTSVMIMRR